MTGKPFEQIIDGEVFYCIAYGSENERQAALKGTGGQAFPAPAPAEREERRPRGRPSFNAVLQQAVEALGADLDPGLSLAERRRRVLRFLAQAGIDASEIPSRSTTEAYLAAHGAPEKYAKKSPGKSGPHKIAGTGG